MLNKENNFISHVDCMWNINTGVHKSILILLLIKIINRMKSEIISLSSILKTVIDVKIRKFPNIQCI